MRTTELFVSEGRVNCPLNGDTDIDHCFTCGHLRDYEVTSDGATLRCTGRRPLVSTFGGDSIFSRVPPF